MASRIQGITVEIGGDTTKLSKALESVNKSIKGTQSGLKDAMYIPPYVYPHKAVTIIPQRKIHSNLITGILRPQRSTPLSVMWSKAVLPPVGWQKR